MDAECHAAFDAQEREGKEVGRKRAEVAKEACILRCRIGMVPSS